MKKIVLLYAILPAWAFIACSSDKAIQRDNRIDDINSAIKKEYIPDSRLNVYDVKCITSKNKIIVKGVTTSNDAKAALLRKLSSMKKIIEDSLQILPEAKLGDKTYGIIDVSVCNIRTGNDYAAELSLQALLGTPIHIIQNQMFYRIQTPDQYIGWAHHAAIKAMTKEEYDAWNRAEKIIITSHYGFTHSQPDENSQVVSDVVSGDRLKWEGNKGDFYKVSYPDGRIAYISKTLSTTEREWRSNLKQDAASIIKTGFSLIGIPYMWGSNSAKGADCSGFIRTILFLHDIIIPRDASQQAHIGQHIDIAPECGNLLPGDLIFFGRKAENGKKEHVSHVAMYIGNQHFIHSLGDVHIGSFNSKDMNYDAYDLNRRLYAVRFLPYLNKEADINTTITNSFYK